MCIRDRFIGAYKYNNAGQILNNEIKQQATIQDANLSLIHISIYTVAGKAFWNAEVEKITANFGENKLADGIIQCVLSVGETLQAAFPYHPTEDRNELPDDIVFGKL